jgi:NhaA family Na+:H+ antiporter
MIIGILEYLMKPFYVSSQVMTFFFGIAAKEVTEALLPGGSLNPPSKAFNPLICTLGGWSNFEHHHFADFNVF